MKKILLILVIISLGSLAGYAQESLGKMFKPDENTLYYDEYDRTIGVMKFMELTGKGLYTFDPTFADGKVVSIKLKKAANSVSLGSKAPDFSVTDIHGKQYTLKELKNKIVVLHFWYTDCIPCLSGVPQLNKLARKYKNDDRVVLLAVTADPKQKVDSFLKKTKFNFDILPSQGELIKLYGVNTYPTNMVIAQGGNVAFRNGVDNSQVVGKMDKVIDSLRSK